jgi:hypothetical protein
MKTVRSLPTSSVESAVSSLRVLKMEAKIYKTTQRYIPEDSKLHIHRCENIKSHVIENNCTLKGKDSQRRNLNVHFRSQVFYFTRERGKN